MIRSSLRTKILLSVGLIIFAVLGTTTLIHIRDLERYYLEAIEWRSEGLAQGILNNVHSLKNYNPQYAQNIQSLLEKLSVRCRQLYDLNKEKNVAHFAVINESGIIAAHNDKEFLNTQVSSLLKSQLKRHEQQIVLDNGIYHTLIPIIEDQDTYLGTIDIGVPQKIVDEKVRQLLLNTAQLFGLFLILAIFMVSLLMHIIVSKPIRRLVLVGKKIAQGELGDTGERDEVLTLLKNIKTRDEIGEITTVFRDMITYLHNMADMATRISNGDLRQEIVPKTEYDVLGNVFHDMVMYLQEISNVAEKISNNELQVEVVPKSEQDTLNMSLQRMVTNLQITRQKVERQNWLKTGQAELSNVMRGEQNAATLAQNVMNYLANYLQAQVGTVYLADDEKVLHLLGSYAYATRKENRNTFALGEGLIGQAALEKRNILFTKVPDDYLAITSGVGETIPRQILVTPFLYEGEVKGVVELGTADEFPEMQRTFLEEAVGNIAIAFHSAQIREKMQELLEASQQQAEELQAQQEQLRVNNEELEAQTDALRQSEQRLQTQQEELRQTNEALEEQTRTLEEQQKILQEKNLELEKARRLVEEKAKELELTSKYKSEFLANMSHELRTPLNSLLILSKLLSENKKGNLTEKQVEFACTIYAAGSELLALINEVLDLSKVEAGRMELNIEEMSLKGFSHYIEQHFTHMAEGKGLNLKVNLADDLPTVIHTDRQRVEQIVKNLLSNAMKFTAKGGWVTFDVARPASHVDFSSSRSGLTSQHVIAFSVSDTGIGIPKDKQRLIFEAFQQADGTTSRKYGGTGLGLSITRELVKLLGGEMHVHSEEGQGSTFTLYLPEVLRTSPQSEQPAKPQADEILQETKAAVSVERPAVFPGKSGGVEAIRDDRHEEISPSDKFLLIIEDDPKFAKILFDLARERGFKGLIAGDVAAGLQLAYQYIPSAIILDIALPGMDGWMVMEKLKQNPETRHIPIHFISVSDQPLEAWKMGAIGYLTKPVTIEQLNEAFQTIEDMIAKTVKKLLIVEDDEATRLSMLELFQGDDVEITTAQTGEETYTLLESEKFDCLVLDLGLEDISGMELLERIRADATLSHIPIVVYTGKDLTKEEDGQLEQYAESIIIKGVKSSERLLDEVTLFLHRVEADLPEAQQKKLRMLHDKEAVLSGKTVLMVDDDMRNVFALTSVFEEKGMHVLVGKNGQEALELLDQHPEIDIVLMDIMMPEMDGYEAMREIRKQSKFRKLPIIALTAKAMKGDRQRCIEAGANDYLSKPVDTNKLLSLLRVWLY